MPNIIYALQWSHYQLHCKLYQVQELLTTFPTSLFELNFWCQAMIFARVSQLDVPQNAVFYLCDQIYSNLLINLSEAEQMKINFKINLLFYIYEIKNNQRLVRNLEEAVMAASALYSFQHPQAQSIKIKSIKQYLKVQGQFLNDNSLNKLSLYLSQKIYPRKELKQIDDLILGTFIVQQIAINTSNIQPIKKYIMLYKKLNAFTSILDHISKSKNMKIINLAIELAQNFQQMGQIMKLFQNNSQIFYRLFWEITKQHKEVQYKNFVIFMVNYSSVKTIILHQNYYLICYHKESKETKQNQIFSLIKQQNKLLLTKFKINPEQTARDCIKYYLKLSNFNIPNNKINQSYSDPLSVMGIIKNYWQHSFHVYVINYCIWILLDRRFAKLNINNPKSEEVKNYCKNLFLAVMHIALGYRLGTFVQFYVIENSRLQQLFMLESLPRLLLCCRQISAIGWVSLYINNQLPRIAKLQYGYNLIQKLIRQKIGNVDQYAITLSNIVDHDLVNKRNNRIILKNKTQILSILNLLSDTKNKENAEKLIRAILMLSNQL